tara:strand:- start:6390 stop:7367 length:978 start_codon:yes stop_codon:yes gene_type:complete
MKVVVTIGTGNSGAGAVHDFLTNCTKYKSPFLGQEFRMMDDPDGIQNLYNNFYVNCSINNPSNAIMRFRNYIHNLIHLKMKINNKNINIYDKKILSLTEEYIQNITTLNYKAYPQFIAIQSNFLERRFSNLKKKIFQSGSENDLFKMYLPVKKDIFFRYSKIYLNKIIKSQLHFKKTNYVILDQSLNMWNFADIFSYFDDVKVILVTRDPRAIFNSMKKRQSGAYPGYDLNVWTKWYDQVIKKFYNYKKNIPKKYMKKVLEIKFENFCNNYELEQKKLLKFIKCKKMNNNFNIEKSRFNTVKAKKELSKFERNYIEKKLSRYLQW